MKAFSGLYLPWKLRRSGAAFLVMDALILLAAWNTGSNLYYLIASALAAFLAVSLVIVGGSLRGVTLKREVPDGVHRDEPFGVHATIVNTKKFLPSFSIRLERTGVDPASVGLVLAISPRRAVTLTLSERIPRRGLHRLPPIDIVTAFPFGLFERRKRHRDRVEVMEYPRVMDLRAFPLDRSAHGGSATRSLRGQGDEFFSLREYVPGVDLRRVAWRVSARFGRPLV